MTSDQLLARLRRFVARCGSQNKAAAEIGVSRSFLSYVLRGRKAPGPQVLKAIGMTRRVHRSVDYVSKRP